VVDLLGLSDAADRNLAAAWTLLGRGAGFAHAEFDTVTVNASGLPSAFFNGAFAAGVAVDPSSTIASTIDFFGARNLPFLLWVRSGGDDDLVEAGHAAGLRDAGGPPLMILPVIDGIPEPPPGLDVRIASSPDELNDHASVVAGGFGMPIEFARVILGVALLEDPDAAMAVGYIGGRPVTTALLARSGETAGVYNVATLDEHRGRGYGAAATWAVIGEGARRGCTHAVLQSSDAGYPVYARMGFMDVGRYRQLEGPPS
jgi:GNAT superfamily N-acetyltransferase